MRTVSYVAADTEPAVFDALRGHPRGKLLAGGTTAIDLAKIYVEQPETFIDINGVQGLGDVAQMASGLRIGALARMSACAQSPIVRTHYPAIARALLLSASPQLRNMASMGGNLLQRTRCSYFRDIAYPCNKRVRGSGCSAIGGDTRRHAVIGGSAACIATYPSDVAVALVALDAVIVLHGPAGRVRRVALDQFLRLPGDTPDIENLLAHDELVAAIEVPAAAHATRSTYLKVRDRQSYEFAFVSAAVGLDIANGRIRAARIALGGVAHKPWRERAVEAALVGRTADEASLRTAAEAALTNATPTEDNRVKLRIARSAIARAGAELLASAAQPT